MKASVSSIRAYRILGWLAVLHSGLLLGALVAVNAGVFSGFRYSSWPWWFHHLWVGLASLWLLWPIVLALHPGRSALRFGLPMVISVLFLIPCIRVYRDRAAITFGIPTVHFVVTYYDRNEDGLVDFELHHAMNAADADWAFCDSQFRGRYDRRIEYSPFGRQKLVDLPVPTHVKITSGEPDSWRVAKCKDPR